MMVGVRSGKMLWLRFALLALFVSVASGVANDARAQEDGDPRKLRMAGNFDVRVDVPYQSGNIRPYVVETLVFDSLTGAALYLDPATPHTHSGYVFNAVNPGQPLQVTKLTVYMASVAAATYTNIRVYGRLWNDWNSANSPVFTSDAFNFSADLGTFNTSANSAYSININFNAPVPMTDLVNNGFAVNFQGDTGAGLSSTDNLTAVVRYGANPITVGTSPLAADTYGYRAASRIDLNFDATDLRTLPGSNFSGLALRVYANAPDPTATPTLTPTSTATNTPIPPRPDTVGVYKDGIFYLRNSNTQGVADITVAFGGDASDLPVVGDWNADGVDTIGVYRNSTGFFFLSNSNTAPNVDYSFVFGNPGDTPFAGRWDNTMTGSGVGVYRNSNGILYQKKVLATGFDDFFAIFGNPGDQGFAGDWNSNVFDSIGVYRLSNTTWYLSNNSTPSGITFSDIDFVLTVPFDWLPFVGDWDGDGDSTPARLSPSGVVGLFPSFSPSSGITFNYGPINSRPVAGKWTAPLQPARNVQIVSGVSGVSGGDNPAADGDNAD